MNLQAIAKVTTQIYTTETKLARNIPTVDQIICNSIINLLL
jgi:hypothetical protein